MEHGYEILMTLREIKELLKTQNNLIEKQHQQPQTKITVVGNKTNPNNKSLKSDEDFFL